MFVGVTIHGEVKEISADSTIIKQGITFTGGTIAAQFCSFLLNCNQERQKIALGMMNLCGETRIAVDVLKSNLAFMLQERVHARQSGMSRIDAGEINPQRPAMRQELLHVQEFEAMSARKPIDRN